MEWYLYLVLAKAKKRIYLFIAVIYIVYFSVLSVIQNTSIYLSIYLSMALQPFGPWPLFQFLNLYTAARTPWTGDQPIAKPLTAHRAAQTQNNYTQTPMPHVGLEPTIPVFERALDRAATVIGNSEFTASNNWMINE
jgi:hypothetical protein